MSLGMKTSISDWFIYTVCLREGGQVICIARIGWCIKVIKYCPPFQATTNTIKMQWMKHSICQTLYHKTWITMPTFGTDLKLTAEAWQKDTLMFTLCQGRCTYQKKTMEKRLSNIRLSILLTSLFIICLIRREGIMLDTTWLQTLWNVVTDESFSSLDVILKEILIVLKDTTNFLGTNVPMNPYILFEILSHTNNI